MIYVFEGGSIVYDTSRLTKEEKAEAVAVEVLPAPEKRLGFTPQLRVDLSTQTVEHIYVETPADPEIETLKQELADLQAQLDLLLG